MTKEKKRSKTICSDSRVLLNRGESRVRSGSSRQHYVVLSGRKVIDTREALFLLSNGAYSDLVVSVVVQKCRSFVKGKRG